MKQKKTTVFLVSFFIVLSVIFMGYFYKVTHANKRSTLRVLGNPGHHIEDFSFTNQDGKTITNADVKGKIYVVSYFFATCKGICPKMNEHLTNVAKAFKGNKNVMILS